MASISSLHFRLDTWEMHAGRESLGDPVALLWAQVHHYRIQIGCHEVSRLRNWKHADEVESGDSLQGF